MPISSSSPSLLSSSFASSSSGPFGAVAGSDENTEHKHAIDFATHSLDLATGGMKTLTAKRELPMRADRRARGAAVHEQAVTRNHTFALLILICLLLMLIGGGVVLFVMLQP